MFFLFLFLFLNLVRISSILLTTLFIKKKKKVGQAEVKETPKELSMK